MGEKTCLPFSGWTQGSCPTKTECICLSKMIMHPENLSQQTEIHLTSSMSVALVIFGLLKSRFGQHRRPWGAVCIWVVQLVHFLGTWWVLSPVMSRIKQYNRPLWIVYILVTLWGRFIRICGIFGPLSSSIRQHRRPRWVVCILVIQGVCFLGICGVLQYSSSMVATTEALYLPHPHPEILWDVKDC